MNPDEPNRPTLDYSQRGTRAPITQTQSEINRFVFWMIALGVIGIALWFGVSLLRL